MPMKVKKTRVKRRMTKALKKWRALPHPSKKLDPAARLLAQRFGTHFEVTADAPPIDVPKQIIRVPFGAALDYLFAGGKVCRTRWQGKGMWVKLCHSWEPGIIGLPGGAFPKPFLVMCGCDSGLTPWTPTSTDILSSDWELLP